MSQLLVGLKEIAQYLRIPLGSLKNKSRELQEARVLFAMWRGRPPKRVICSTTERLQAWLIALSEEK
jgi:hypothetical protein